MADSARRRGDRVEIWPFAWWMGWPRSAWYFKNLLAAVPRIARLVRYLKRNRIDLVYTNSAVIFEPAIAARLARIAHIWHVHEVLKKGDVAHGVFPLGVMKKVIEKLSDRIIFESHASKKAFEAGNETGKSRVVYNSVRFADAMPTPERESTRASLGARPDDVVVGFVGQLIDRKNPLLLLRAAARLRNLPNLRFVLVGEGPLLQAVRKTIADLGLAAKCRSVGFQKDVTQFLAAFDLLVLPSRQESFGLVLIEAGAFGKPVIATRTEGPAEIIADRETGFLVEPDDEADLADKIKCLSEDAELRRRMGEAGRQRVHQRFSAVNNARQVQEIIDDVLGRGKLKA